MDAALDALLDRLSHTDRATLGKATAMVFPDYLRTQAVLLALIAECDGGAGCALNGRDLATAAGVSPDSCWKAISKLEAKGHIDARRRPGKVTIYRYRPALVTWLDAPVATYPATFGEVTHAMLDQWPPNPRQLASAYALAGDGGLPYALKVIEELVGQGSDLLLPQAAILGLHSETAAMLGEDGLRRLNRIGWRAFTNALVAVAAINGNGGENLRKAHDANLAALEAATRRHALTLIQGGRT